VRYRHLEISHGGSKPTDKELKAIEAAVGAKLPPDFKAFLAAANGATIPYSVNAKSVDSDDPLNFREILCTGGDDEGTFLGELAALRARWNIPLGVLPFAREYCDSFALLDLRPQTYGAVLALLTDLQPETAVIGEPVLIRLADSFGAYVDSLVPELSDEALG
jgi:SMI1 / KNR4 family (SUKH-1)